MRRAELASIPPQLVFVLQNNIVFPNAELNVQYAYRGENRCNVDSTFQGSCGAYTGFEVGEEQHTTNARLGWTSSDKSWGAALYVQNLFDEQYVRSIGGQGLSVLGTPVGTITAPRMFGIEGSFRF